ncbi:MAG: redoxin domain-containing protein [Acidimicrobiia bacterium]
MKRKAQRSSTSRAPNRRERKAAELARHHRQRRVWWATGALALVALVGLAVVAAGADGGGTGDTEPTAFDLPAIQGEERIRLADHRGKPVVVNFFASWCTSCDFELPGFARVSDELRGTVTFIGVNALETGDPMTMPERHGITWWPLARDVGSRGNDLHAALGGRGMPITAFYDAAGQLLHVDPGTLDETTLRARITDLYQIEV